MKRTIAGTAVLYLVIATMGCNEQTKPEPEIISPADTVSTLPFSQAPRIYSIDQESGPSNACIGKTCLWNNWVTAKWNPIETTIGYNLYASQSPDSGFKKVTSGKLEGASRKYFFLEVDGGKTPSEGVWYLKVEALAADGASGPQSDARAFYYDRVVQP